jgi:hypothetical protein
MLSFRVHLTILIAVFGAMIGIAILGNVLAAAGIIHDLGAWKLPMLILIFGLFLASGFAAVPVIVMSVLGFQRKIGNESVPIVASVLKSEKIIIYVLWALMLAGVVIGLPAAIHGGLFNPHG